jgi:hypothetical protein
VTIAAGVQRCAHCGNYHMGVCPRVKSIEYYENGQIQRIEYFSSLPVYRTHTDDSVCEWCNPSTK